VFKTTQIKSGRYLVPYNINDLIKDNFSQISSLIHH